MAQRTALLVAMAVLVLAAVTACTVDHGLLVGEIRALPGVTQASVNYGDSGGVVTLDVRMEGSNTAQIRDVVESVSNARTGGLQRLLLGLGGKPRLFIDRDIGSLDANGIIADTIALRTFATAIAATSPKALIASNPGNQLRVTLSATPVPALLDALQDTAAGTVSRVNIRPADDNATTWDVMLPLSGDNAELIEHQMSAMPVHVDAVTAHDATITELEVAVSSPTADHDLVEVINELGAGPDHRLRLSWRIHPPDRYNYQYALVDVGGCDYPGTYQEQHPEKKLSPEQIAQQNRLRRQFDTCPK